MSEIGAQRSYVERPGLPAYDWNESTLTIDTASHSLDLSAIVPYSAVWVKFQVIVTAGSSTKAVWIKPTASTAVPDSYSRLSTGVAGTLNIEVFIKLSSPQTFGYLVQVGITALTIRILGWML